MDSSTDIVASLNCRRPQTDINESDEITADSLPLNRIAIFIGGTKMKKTVFVLQIVLAKNAKQMNAKFIAFDSLLETILTLSTVLCIAKWCWTTHIHTLREFLLHGFSVTLKALRAATTLNSNVEKNIDHKMEWQRNMLSIHINQGCKRLYDTRI
jgi:hypothetical protein